MNYVAHKSRNCLVNRPLNPNFSLTYPPYLCAVSQRRSRSLNAEITGTCPGTRQSVPRYVLEWCTCLLKYCWALCPQFNNWSWILLSFISAIHGFVSTFLPNVWVVLIIQYCTLKLVFNKLAQSGLKWIEKLFDCSWVGIYVHDLFVSVAFYEFYWMALICYWTVWIEEIPCGRHSDFWPFLG